MSKIKLLAIALLSGVLMTLSWAFNMAFAPLMLFAFVPMLWVEDYISNNMEKFSSTSVFRYTILPFLLFTSVNTLWISKSTPVGLIIPLFEACCMALVMQLYHFTKKVSNNSIGSYFFLMLYWIALEYIQFIWDLNFPWLNLGNTFANYPVLVQWYSVLGMEGGSLWILLANIFIFLHIKKIKRYSITPLSSTKTKRLFGKYQEKVFVGLILGLPVVWSLVLWYSYEDDNVGEVDTIVVQPNLDPYQEQFVLSPFNVTMRSINLIEPLMDDDVDYVLMPESAIQEYAWEENIDSVASIMMFNDFLSRYKKAELIAGVSSRRLLPKGVKTSAAREFRDAKGEYYESCNIAVDVPRSKQFDDYQIRHKSVLTPGVEKMPFAKYLSFVEKLALDMGGTVGSLGIDTTNVVFSSKVSGNKVATAICYESVDGNYMRKFTKEGAQVLFIMTNDGWWGDTKGYKHHFAFARLRAIENRRYIARSANTGLSGFISPKGEIIEKGHYWQQEAFRQRLPLQNQMTFFAKNGDIIMKPFSFFAILLFVYSTVTSKVRKKPNAK